MSKYTTTTLFSKKKITSVSNSYIENSFKKAFEIIKKQGCCGLINGPVSKKSFLKGEYNGITEYLAHKTNTKNFGMLIYNKNLSVCALTTHLPIKNVSKNSK